MAKKGWTIGKVPYGGGCCSLNQSNPKGTKYAPDALEKEFERQNIFMADNGSLNKPEWLNIGTEFGFWRQNNHKAWFETDERLRLLSKNFMRENGNVLFLGGSHTITYSTFGALRDMYGASVGLVVLDAHPDCCHKADWPIHSDWLRELVQRGRAYVLPENIILIGIRQIEKEEYDFLKSYGIKYYPMSKIGDPKTCVTDNWSLALDLERIGKLKASYVSIDIDVVSQAFAPGTACPSPGGVTDNELIALTKPLKSKLPNLKVMDLVEIIPLNRLQKMVLRRDITIDLGVKLIKEIVS